MNWNYIRNSADRGLAVRTRSVQQSPSPRQCEEMDGGSMQESMHECMLMRSKVCKEINDGKFNSKSVDTRLVQHSVE